MQKKKTGKLIDANEGTLYIEEVEKLNYVMQSKLLEAIENEYIIPVGGTAKDKKNFRIKLVTASSISLEEEVVLGNIRKDLYHALSGIKITIPSLEKRPEDRIILVDSKIKQLQNIRAFVFYDEAIEILNKYHWYGNLVELDKYFSELERIERPVIKPQSIPRHIKDNINLMGKNSNSFLSKEIIKLIEKNSYQVFKEKLEAYVIDYYFDKFNFNKSEVRSYLGVSRRAFDKSREVIEHMDSGGQSVLRGNNE